MKTQTVVVLLALLTCQSRAQTLLFDFETAPPSTPLPINLTVGGCTAHFSATGQGFSIQQVTVQGLHPVGFSGYCIYPSSVFAADLLVSFSEMLTDFSILYAPEEYGCDSSATMRVTAYRNGTFVGTATTNAQAGTWPSETLAFSSAQGFNSVVVHYDAAPVTGGDYGPVFMADNMSVTLAPPPPTLEISWLNPQIQVTWPTNAAGFILQESVSVGSTNWTTCTNAISIIGTNQQMRIPASPSNCFYRLFTP